MQKTKVTLLSIGLTFISAIGALTSTFAWFETTNRLNAGNDDSSVEVKSSAGQIGDLDVYLNVDLDNSDFGKVGLTDNNGDMWTVKYSGGKYVYEKDTTSGELHKFGQVYFIASFKVNGEDATAEQLTPYVNQSCSFNVSGGERTRLSGDVVSVFTGFTQPIMLTVTVTGTTLSSYTISPSNYLYFSLSGGSVTPTEGATCTEANIDRITEGNQIAKINIEGINED